MRHLFLLTIFLFLSITAAQSQATREVPQSQQFRLGEGIVRIAEPGQLADTLNVWGDVNNPGRYLVPRGMNLASLVSYARGPARLTTNETSMDWSKLRLEISVSQKNGGFEEITNFRYSYNDPVPQGMRDFKLENEDIISIQVRRRASFVDYVRVIAPVVSTVATSILIVERLR